jgi:DNA invertase Pin-like site-specific DNA recombinase
MKYLMYLRKSSESDEKQKTSIADQERHLASVVEARGLQIVGEPLRESKSAKYPGRPLFNELLKRVERGEAQGVIAFSLDRLARNSVDSGRLIAMLTSGKIQEVVTHTNTFSSSGTDKLTMGVQFVLAEYYVDNLSEHVGKSVKGRLEAGRWPSKPKLGYVRDPKTKELVADPERFHLVKEMFRLRLAGESFQSIERLAREAWGLTTPVFGKIGGRPLCRAQIYGILHDPFYAGQMRSKATLYQGNHVPMISWEEFTSIQESFRGKPMQAPRPKLYSYPYRGLIECGECGRLVTAERKVNRYGTHYLYWHCAKRTRLAEPCLQPSIEHEELDTQLDQFFSGFAFPPEVVDWLLRELDALEDERREKKRETADRLRDLIARGTSKLARLRTLCIDDHITPAELDADRRAIENEQIVWREELAKLERDERAFEPFRESILMLSRDAPRFKELLDNEKRLVVQRACSNLRLHDKTMLITAKEPVRRLYGAKTIPSLLANWNDVRNLLIKPCL